MDVFSRGGLYADLWLQFVRCVDIARLPQRAHPIDGSDRQLEWERTPYATAVAWISEESLHTEKMVSR